MIVATSAVAELWMAWHWFGFLTGDDVEVLAEAFRVATGFHYRSWDIRNLLVPHFIVAPPIYIANRLGVDDTRALIVIATLPFIASSAISTILVAHIARIFCEDRRVEIIAVALFGFHWIPLGFASTVYPRTIGTMCVLAAAYIVLTRESRAAGFAAGALAALAFADRYSEIVFLLPLTILARRRWLLVLFGFGVVVILVIGVYDYVTWGEPFASLQNFAHLTLVESDFSSRLKHQSPAWYFENIARWLAPTLLPFLWFARRQWRVLLFIGIPMLMLSLVGHKELRYLHGIVPWLMLLAAIGFARMPWRRTAAALVVISIVWQVSGVRQFARKSMPAVEAARMLGADPDIATVVMSQLWAYGDRLYFGDRIAPRDVGTPPVRLAAASRGADAVCLYESDVAAAEIEILKNEGFKLAHIFRSPRARDVVVFRPISQSASDTSGRARR